MIFYFTTPKSKCKLKNLKTGEYDSIKFNLKGVICRMSKVGFHPICLFFYFKQCGHRNQHSMSVLYALSDHQTMSVNVSFTLYMV